MPTTPCFLQQLQRSRYAVSGACVHTEADSQHARLTAQRQARLETVHLLGSSCTLLPSLCEGLHKLRKWFKGARAADAAQAGAAGEDARVGQQQRDAVVVARDLRLGQHREALVLRVPHLRVEDCRCVREGYGVRLRRRQVPVDRDLETSPGPRHASAFDERVVQVAPCQPLKARKQYTPRSALPACLSCRLRPHNRRYDPTCRIKCTPGAPRICLRGDGLCMPYNRLSHRTR